MRNKKKLYVRLSKDALYLHVKYTNRLILLNK